MKSKRIQYLEKILRWMAAAVIKKYKPSIVGITGSVGKTSAKEAVFLVLSQKFRTRKSDKNYNNEIGIPLTVIGARSGKRSLWKWLAVFARWLFIMVFPVKYPKILVLEMGVDHPGDMKRLTSFIPVSVGIVTNISSSHLEFFKSVGHIAKEKRKLLEALPEEGTAILNADDNRVKNMKNAISSKIITFGLGEADVRASCVDFNYNGEHSNRLAVPPAYRTDKPASPAGRLSGISFKLGYAGKIIPVRLRHILAQHHIYAILAGISAGIAFKINLVDIAESLDNFFPPPGRMNLVSGIKNSFIIDDTYNASPASASAALDILKKIKAVRKITVMGDMLELGKDMEGGHRKIAKKIFQLNPAFVFTVGDRMKIAVEELRSSGYPADRMFHFDDPVSAGKKLQEKIREGDLILIKGSQAMRMEKIVEEIMLKPREAKNILCRQSPDWRKRPYIKS